MDAEYGWSVIPPETGEVITRTVVVKIGNPSAWRRTVLDRTGVLDALAKNELYDRLRDALRIEHDTHDPQHVARATLTWRVTPEQAARAKKLIDRPPKKKGAQFTNSYQLTGYEERDGAWWITVCLAQGRWLGDPDETRYRLSMLPAKFFQGLLMSYLSSTCPSLMALPRVIRSGACQDVAQTVLGHVALLNSVKVKGMVSFPTLGELDPDKRRAQYEESLKALLTDVRPLQTAPVRTVHPDRYPEDDSRGDTKMVIDERWLTMLRGPDPRPGAPSFVSGDAVMIVSGRTSFDAGRAKRQRHGSKRSARRDVRRDRPERIRQRGHTGMGELGQVYAALPLLDSDDDVIRSAAARAGKLGRGTQLNLSPVSMQERGRREAWFTRQRKAAEKKGGQTRQQKGHGPKPWQLDREKVMLVPIQFDRQRFRHIFSREDLETATFRLVNTDGEWYLQLTLRIPCPPAQEPEAVMGVAFSIDAVASWVVLDLEGRELERGAIAPNSHIRTLLERKGVLEGEQKKLRWIGGSTFAQELDTIAHGSVNGMMTLAIQRRAALGVERVEFVRKSGKNKARNSVRSAWDYGRLRRMFESKAPGHGFEVPWFVSDYIVSLTCPSCGAIRKKGEDKESATTWQDQETGELHCRSCGYRGVLTQEDRALRVAKETLARLMKRRAARKKREEKKKE